MSGNPPDVLRAISERHKLEPTGDPSLQNAIEMAKSTMSHLPTHSSREILIIFGSLTTCDPGNIHETLESCIRDKIRISIVALAAEMKICRELSEKTGGQFGVAMNEGHFKDLLFELIPPPAQHATSSALTSRLSSGASANAPGNVGGDLMLMGFPTRLPDTSPPSLCVCHSEMKSQGFLCPRCSAKVCDIPTDCDVCGLMIVSSPHLARSYHHLFPVKVYRSVMTLEETANSSPTCHGCSRVFQTTALSGAGRRTSAANRDSNPNSTNGTGGAAMDTGADGVSPLGRYRCTDCSNDFCAECDVFIHDVLHCCPGCER